MAVGDMPTFAASAYASSTFSLDEVPSAIGAIMPHRRVANSIGEGAFEDAIRRKLETERNEGRCSQ